MERNKIRVAITQGDINGVGYEVILKTFADPAMLELCTPIIYGSPKVAAYHRKMMNLQTNFSIVSSASEAAHGKLSVVSCAGDELKVEFAKPSEEAGQAALDALEHAVADWRAGLIDVLVTAPINKATIQSDSFHFPGHTEFIQERAGDGAKALMILMKDDLRVALVTGHIQEIIIPAMEAARAKGIQCFGPYAADGFMGSDQLMAFDGVLAMYHDQGLAPFKALAMDEGVNFTAGLPLVRTSPDHGTAYDIAGKGIASEASFRQAVYTAIDVFRNRLHDKECRVNPLRKQYYEKRDDSDKLKLDAVDDEEIL